MPKYKHGSGTIYQQTKIGANGKKRILKTWWLSYYDADGRRVRESTKTTDAAEARSKLNERLGEIAKGEYTGPAADRITVKELIDEVLTDYQVKGKKDVRCARIKATKHLAPFFAGKTAHGLKTADVKGFIKKRRQPASAAPDLEDHGSQQEAPQDSFGGFKMNDLDHRAKALTDEGAFVNVHADVEGRNTRLTRNSGSGYRAGSRADGACSRVAHRRRGLGWTSSPASRRGCPGD